MRRSTFLLEEISLGLSALDPIKDHKRIIDSSVIRFLLPEADGIVSELLPIMIELFRLSTNMRRLLLFRSLRRLRLSSVTLFAPRRHPPARLSLLATPRLSSPFLVVDIFEFPSPRSSIIWQFIRHDQSVPISGMPKLDIGRGG
jgi:hypothetical protein